jgi:ATP-dependent DNA helicase RecG
LLPADDALELLPADVLAGLGLPSLRASLLTLHRPSPQDDLQAWRRCGTRPARLALEELLAHHLSLRRQRIAMRRHRAPPLAPPGQLVERLRQACRSR